jgi:hypothetical protein
MRIAPIPAFLVLDGFTSDVHAAELLERIASVENTDGEMYTHLKNFLLACLEQIMSLNWSYYIGR